MHSWERTRETLPAILPSPWLVALRLVLSMTLLALALCVSANSSVVASEGSEAKPIASATKKKKRSFPGAKKIAIKKQTVKPKNGKLKLRVELKLPEGFKINPDAPMGFLLETVGEAGPIDRSKPSKYQLVKPPKESFDLLIPVTGTGDERLRLSMNYYHCQGDPTTGICQTGSVIMDIPIMIAASAKKQQVDIKYDVPTL